MKEKIINGLLIEDDPEDTMLLMDLMAKSDWPSFTFAFTCAEDMETGLRLLSENNFEVVLLDLMLPDSQGIETVLKVRAQAPDIPLVVLTGLRDEALGLSAVRHGAQDYQVKGSIDGHALKRTISYAVERHRWAASFKNIIESAPDGMILVDIEGKVLYVNPSAEALFACKGEQWLGKPFPYSLPNGSFGELKISVDGREDRIAEIRVSEIEWKDQSARLASIRDMTELRRVEQLKAEIYERRKMDKLKDELIGTVSHEMRNPLTIIKATAINLKNSLAGVLSEKQTETILLQYKNILRLEKILNHILDLSWLESGKAVIKPRAMNAAELIRETVLGFRLVAGERHILIQQEIPSDLPPIYADPDLFVQVLANLIDNAMRFTETRILIRAAVVEPARDVPPTAAKHVQISVIDDGPGISKEHLGELFNKFVQVNRSSKIEGYKGTGLGLSICKEIIERQGGKIWAESTFGQGAQFHYILPQYEPGSISRQEGVYAQ